jgi:urease accessory protein
MYVSDSPSDGSYRPVELKRQRALGQVTLGVECLAGRTRAMRIAESGSMRVRLPRVAGPALEAVLVNTAGGIACGDRFNVSIEAGAAAHVILATPTAEKIYKSDGPLAEVAVSLRLDKQATLEWLPQETILFNRARLARSLQAEMHSDACLSMFEAVVFGRQAHDERMTEGMFQDRWRIRRAGRLVFADTFRLSGPIADFLARPSVAGGARAIATFLHVAPDAEARLQQARDCLVPVPGCDAAASAWNGMLAVRFCAGTIEALRASACRFLLAFRAAPLPRVWLS